jgi:osmotically-inducible protein OsmY
MKTLALGRALILIAVAACARSLRALPPVAAPNVGAIPTHNADPAVSDQQILHVLLRELDRDAVTGHEHIRAQVVVGVVRVSGSVASLAADDRAQEIAHLARGARAVIDGITLAPRERSDVELECTIAGVLGRDPVTADSRLAARAEGGAVRLWGEADSMATRRIAEADVRAIPGVRKVTNDLDVRPQRVADSRIAAEVERALDRDPWLRDPPPRVEVHGGLVLLSGSVGSAAERARAEYDARSAAPKGVDLAPLRIETTGDDGTLRATPGWTPSDSQMTTALLDGCALDPRTKGFVPTVDVRHRAVLLTGAAPDSSVLRAVEEDARNVQGALSVQNDMRDRQTIAVESDDALLSEVSSALARDASLGPLRLSVGVRNGRVYLSGTVPTSAARANAIAVASSVEGARDVYDGLVVAPVRFALR